MVAWLLDNSLWLVGLGLMLASSGIDGAYMTKWMPPTASWLGYVLNTVSDVAGMVLMYWYGRLLQTRKNESGGKRRLQLSRVILGAEGVMIGYSWLFGWRQLLIVMLPVEGNATRWVAPITAGFIPLSLAFAGYVQSLRAGRIEEKEEAEEASQAAQPATQDAEEATQPAQTEAQPATQAIPIATQVAGDNGHRSHACLYCGATATKDGMPFANSQAISAHLKHCDAYQAHKAQEMAQ